MVLKNEIIFEKFRGHMPVDGPQLMNFAEGRCVSVRLPQRLRGVMQRLIQKSFITHNAKKNFKILGGGK
jgi:hypothetical protein